MPRSAPMASAVRIVSWAAAGPSAITTTSPAPAFSFRRSASSTANSSYGLRMNLTPASSSDLPSAAILTRVSESGTRLMHTAILIRGDATTPRCTLQVVNHDSARGKQTCGFSSGNLRMTSRRSDVKRLEIRTDAHEQMPQHARRDEPLHGIARNGRVLGERAERDVATVEHVRDRDAD